MAERGNFGVFISPIELVSDTASRIFEYVMACSTERLESVGKGEIENFLKVMLLELAPVSRGDLNTYLQQFQSMRRRVNDLERAFTPLYEDAIQEQFVGEPNPHEANLPPKQPKAAPAPQAPALKFPTLKPKAAPVKKSVSSKVVPEKLTTEKPKPIKAAKATDVKTKTTSTAVSKVKASALKEPARKTSSKIAPPQPKTPPKKSSR